MHPRIDHRSGVPRRSHNRSFRRIETPLEVSLGDRGCLTRRESMALMYAHLTLTVLVTTIDALGHF